MGQGRARSKQHIHRDFAHLFRTQLQAPSKRRNWKAINAVEGLNQCCRRIATSPMALAAEHAALLCTVHICAWLSLADPDKSVAGLNSLEVLDIRDIWNVHPGHCIAGGRDVSRHHSISSGTFSSTRLDPIHRESASLLRAS